MRRLIAKFLAWRLTPPPSPLPSRGGGVALLFAAIALFTYSAAANAPAPVNDAAIMAAQPARTLAEYRLFTDAGARAANARVTPYDLNTALYSDGALKFRYVYVPQGARAEYNADGVFAFPVGTVLVKTFAYAADMRRPNENVRFLETRLLIRREAGWVALPYVWNEAQNEARLSVAGADVPVRFTDEQGQALALDWAVPNVNECRGCHLRGGAVEPIGPSARNLNRQYDYGDLMFVADGAAERVGQQDQLRAWAVFGFLDRLPPDRLDGRPTRPRVPNAYDPNDGALAERARAYLDVNCAHCHNPAGPAHTSGLDLSWSQQDPIHWGVMKRPVAAGRGSAGYDFSIEPGHPERSILLHRMESTDPGVMMPELGRQLRDERALALMRDWIASMDA
ncbi:MAG TPA: SO2930 family diheme c-type cytochrome, partial [Terricaulis sp.]|nr:SO2930 family diheme c-type cytochrome [Terricaulis sp.]